tara:strand:- start:10314 stop:10619 length:306 start_codon:yes stop_codon:yes gene_type:complete
MTRINLCETCVYGHHVEGTYVHRDGLDEIIKAGETEEPEEWESWKGPKPGRKTLGNSKEIEMTICYCYYPIQMDEVEDGDKNKEFHDMHIYKCNRYKAFKV